MIVSHCKDIPVSLFLAVSIVLVFALYITTVLKTVPCGRNILSSFCGNFVHIDLFHLVANLITLYTLTRVERDIGAKRFSFLIVFLLVFTSIVEVTMHKIIPNMACTIGFSCILFGIMAWELTTKRGLDLLVVISIIGVAVMPTIQNPKRASLLGHLVGVVSGIIGGLLWTSFSV
jgi:membrane associated rhomboid family serine protease